MLHRHTAGTLVLALSLSGCAHFGGGFHFGAVFAHVPAALGRVAIAPLRVGIASAPAVVTAIAAPRVYPAFTSSGRAVPAPDSAPPEVTAREAAGQWALAPFNGTAARASLQQVDLAACRGSGLPRGYVHARVTFANAGRVARIEVDGPDGLSQASVTCVGRALGRASVPPFIGDGSFSVGVTSFVK